MNGPGGLLGALQEAREAAIAKRQRDIQRGMTGPEHVLAHVELTNPIIEAGSLARTVRRKVFETRAYLFDPDATKNEIDDALTEILALIGADHTEVR
jgi:hypothetical protein